MLRQTGVIAKKDNYTVEVNYSKQAIKNKLIKFNSLKGKSIEISADELIAILTQQVNTKTLAPLFVEVDRVNVVEVGRQISCVLTEDMKKGQKININYTHPLPIEFALIEEAYKIASIKKDVPVFTLTAKYIEEVKRKMKPGMQDYIKKFYKSFKNIDLDKK